MSDVKKAIYPAVILTVILGAILVAVLLKDAGGAVPEDLSEIPVARRTAVYSPALLSPQEVLQRVEGASPAGLRKQLDALGKTRGQQRKAVWRAAIAGLEAGRDVRVRTRSARLASKLAAKPNGRYMGPADPEAVPALLSCLDSPDAELVRHSLQALGTLHLTNPAMGVRSRVTPGLRKLLASGDAGRANSAVIAVPMFKDLDLAGQVIAAWERHRSVTGFQAQCLSTLRILAKQRLKDAERKASPKKADRECWKAAENKVKTLGAQLGSNPAKWKDWWGTDIAKR